MGVERFIIYICARDCYVRSPLKSLPRPTASGTVRNTPSPQTVNNKRRRRARTRINTGGRPRRHERFGAVHSGVHCRGRVAVAAVVRRTLGRRSETAPDRVRNTNASRRRDPSKTFPSTVSLSYRILISRIRRPLLWVTCTNPISTNPASRYRKPQ